MAHLLLIYLLKMVTFSYMFVYKKVCLGTPSSYSWDDLLNPRSWTFETVATCSNDGRLGRDGEEMEGNLNTDMMSFNGLFKRNSPSETGFVYNISLIHQISCCCLILYDCFVCFCNPPQLFVTQLSAVKPVKQPWQTKEWNKKLEKAEESLGCQVRPRAGGTGGRNVFATMQSPY